MPVGEITSDAVRAAIRECEEMGRDRFLEHYGFKRARSYYLVFEGKFYDSKAILGVAHRHQFPGTGPLKPSDFSGGKDTVKPRLESLGFEVVVK
jgi:5-methylcytosine-specific restriction enzyme A